MGMSSFFSHGVKEHLGASNQLMKLSAMLDWSAFSPFLSDIHSDRGPTGYDPIQMFKTLLLGQWHSLSDPALEESLRVRLDFLEFTGFALGGDLPDETTLCRFRNKLVQNGKLPLLLCEVNRQLEVRGLKLKSATTAIVDATLIESAARPRKEIEADETGEYAVSYSADAEAKWLRKGNKTHFGYQSFVQSDAEGFVEHTHTTPANLPETKELERAVEAVLQGRRVRVLADKGFASAANKAMLHAKKIKCGIMRKAARGRPLSAREKLLNKLISRQRFRIEQCFGTLKRRFNFRRSSYFTTAKTEAQMLMKCLCLNLLKGMNKWEFA
jgi:transposase, IS5 family